MNALQQGGINNRVDTLIEKIIWMIGVLRRTVVNNSPSLLLTTVLLRTPIIQMIFFNQGMLLLGSNHFLINGVYIVNEPR